MTDDPMAPTMKWAGALVALGAAMMVLKGGLLIATGQDRSLVPWFAFFVSVGLSIAALALWRSADTWRWLAAAGLGLSVVGVAASVVSVAYLVSGTIPETPGAPDAVGLSYAVSSAAIALSVLALGVLIVKIRAMVGGWRWLPVGLLVAQLPIFIVAGALGDTVGSEDLTDGLGLALTGVAWVLFGWAVAYRSCEPSSALSGDASSRVA